MGRKVAKRIGGNVDIVGSNGAFVICNGEFIRETFFEKEVLKEIIDYVRAEIDPGLIILTTHDQNQVFTRTMVSKWTNFMYMVYYFFQGVYRDPFVRSDKVFCNELEKGQVYKLMFLNGLSKKKKEKGRILNEELKKKFPQAEFSWVGEFIEVTPKGCTKSNGINFYLDYNGLSKDNVLVIGDSGNDISMFDAFKEQSYCMEHGPKSVKAHASHTIRRFYDLEEVLYPSEDSKSTAKESR